MCVVAALGLGGLVAIGDLTGAAVNASRAQLAADAAALAGIVAGPEAAAEAALRNGGVLSQYSVDAGDVIVEVHIGHLSGRARAGR